ncbi:hypothetical protein ISS86_01590 [Candidatus Microgenomates bacterium]|nr:hypothetical protein [Candidatus Microgenomates bacterium]
MTVVPYFWLEDPDLKFSDKTENIDVRFQPASSSLDIVKYDLLLEHFNIIQESRKFIEKGEIITWEDFLLKNGRKKQE